MRAGLSSGAHLARILTGSTQGPGQPPPCLPLRSAKTRNNALQLSKIANARVIPEKNKNFQRFTRRLKRPVKARASATPNAAVSIK